jgi:hypothetical protein
MRVLALSAQGMLIWRPDCVMMIASGLASRTAFTSLSLAPGKL